MTAGGLMTAPVPAVELDKARSDLREAVDDLTTIAHHKWDREDGTTKHATTPPLLVQVANEIAGNSQNQGGNSWRSKPPLWFEGSALLAEVDKETSRYDGNDRCGRVRAWCNHLASHGTPDGVLDAATTAERWRGGCKALLNPRPKFRVRGQACPNCGLTKVWDRHDRDNGENHARPALEIDQDRGLCVCLSCEYTWAPDYWPILRQVLEQQQEETLAQSEPYDATVRIGPAADEAGVSITPCTPRKDQL